MSRGAGEFGQLVDTVGCTLGGTLAPKYLNYTGVRLNLEGTLTEDNTN